MNTINSKKLYPFPTGWYVIAKCNELEEGKLITKKFAGKDLIIFKTVSGKLGVVDAYCPHMGAHFGHGGEVKGETIRCPFHYFCFDNKGICTETGYNSAPPKNAVLKTYTFKEVNGFIIVWHSIKNEDPNWQIPETENAEWSEIMTTDFDLTSHPQETTENSVDVGHFSVVHKYSNVHELKELNVDGAYLNASYGFDRKGGILNNNGIKAQINIHVYGLGYSFVEVNLPEMELYTRQYVFPTPIEDGRINLKIGMSVKRINKPSKLNPFLALIPKSIVNKLVLKQAFKSYAHDVMQDFDVWKNKIFIENPALAMGDGPIIKYRKWTKQFYEGLNENK
jgi:phenylpropionate dioxygenase-like ring-hydroxylating dioxygenase large terminal subunit